MGAEEFFIALVSILVVIGMPVVLGFILVNQYFKGRNAERLALISQGIVPESIERPEKKANRYPALRNGLFMIGISLGIVVGVILGPIMVVNHWMDLTIFTMAILFGGISFVIYFFLSRKLETQEKQFNNDPFE